MCEDKECDFSMLNVDVLWLSNLNFNDISEKNNSRPKCD